MIANCHHYFYLFYLLERKCGVRETTQDTISYTDVTGCELKAVLLKCQMFTAQNNTGRRLLISMMPHALSKTADTRILCGLRSLTKKGMQVARKYYLQ